MLTELKEALAAACEMGKKKTEAEIEADAYLQRWKVLLMGAMRGAALQGKLDVLHSQLVGWAITETKSGKKTTLRSV